MSLYETYKTSWRAALQKTIWKKNIHEVPTIEKIVVSMWIGSLATRKGVKDFSDLDSNLAIITGQKPAMIYSKKAVSNFKLREGQPVMLRVTLRRQKAYDFLERLVKYTLPRLRDFNWISPKKFDSSWNLNIWFVNQSIFPEFAPDDIKTLHWLQMTVVSTSDSADDSMAMLESLGMIFEK